MDNKSNNKKISKKRKISETNNINSNKTNNSASHL